MNLNKQSTRKVKVMPSNSESQCYFVQLQIDSYLDGDMSTAQQGDFISHVHGCEACAREFHYAQTVQDAVLDLPQLDCDEQVLEPIYRLANGGSSDPENTGKSLWTQIGELFATAPVFLRYAIPVALVAVFAVFGSTVFLTPGQNIPVATQQAAIEPVEQFSPEQIRQAVQDLNLAIDYLNEVSRRTEVMIGDRFLITPLKDSINASFERVNTRRNARLRDDPI